MEKRCTGPCGELKPIEAFSKRSKAKDGRQAWCKICVKERQKKLRRPIDPKKQRAFNLKRRYGLTVEQWDEMLIAQSGLCALCMEALRDPHVDHSHATGEVRGLLCLWCNTMLGRVERLGLPYIERYLLPKEISCSMALNVSEKSSVRFALYWRFLSSSYN